MTLRAKEPDIGGESIGAAPGQAGGAAVNRVKRWLSAPRWLFQKLCCCDIPMRFWSGVAFPHPIGIVIGDGVKIGQRVTIYQNVTIGLKRNFPGVNESFYPTIDDDVTVYAGAVIVGAIHVGERSVVGANALLSCDVPPDSVVIGHNEIRPRSPQTAGRPQVTQFRHRFGKDL